jgi:hypothetical protein
VKAIYDANRVYKCWNQRVGSGSSSCEGVRARD